VVIAQRCKLLCELTIIVGAPNSGFDQLSTFNDGFDSSAGFPYPPSVPSTTASYPGSLIDPLNDTNFSLFTTSSTNEHLGFLEPLSPYLAPPGQTVVHEELVMHYFSNVRKIQFLFAEELTDYTYSVSISLNPRIFCLELLDRPCSANPEGQ
jgi:hypothetical protein